MAASTTTTAQRNTILAQLSIKSLNPTTPWLAHFLSTNRAANPLSLAKTAEFRLLASDITTTLSLSPSTTFPADVLNAQVKERRLTGPIVVQVLDVQDLGRSRWSQVEGLEAAERGEMTKGREIIRTVPGEEGEGGDGERVERSSGPHKLLVQDAAGSRVYGIELDRVELIGLGMNIGAKLLLKNVTVARGVLLLGPGVVTVLGGKVEAWDKSWKEGRKERLMADAGQA